ncbi:UMP kinase [Patescibacteria group bacterium]|nr:UMP kinase [Patescibacteria group bacterium]MBU1612872.1 UMP kinase [Patescibacteria group bacterium]
MTNNKLTVISLGGSLIAPKEGFDIEFLKNFRDLIVKFIKNGHKFIIVCGGGQTARNYQSAARGAGELQADDIDWMGIHATRLNAHLMKTILRDYAHPIVIKNPTLKTEWDEQVLLAGGWKPGWSTDYDAVKLAELYGAKTLINMSNISYVYDDDPRANPEAKKIENISWSDFRKIVGDEWSPGANTPFDPVASKEAEKLGLKVIFVKGTELSEVKKAILGKDYLGTTIE